LSFRTNLLAAQKAFFYSAACFPASLSCHIC